MQTSYECVSCLVRQSVEAVLMATSDEKIREDMIRSILREIAGMDFKRSAPYLAAEINRKIRLRLKNNDPYQAVKKRFNRFALQHYEQWHKLLEQSGEPFETALRLAIAGNIIDFGVKGEVSESEVQHTIKNCLELPIRGNSINEFKEAVSEADKIMLLGDNAGEIVFDRFLLGQLPRERVTYVVKGEAIINDATMEDARETGLTELVRVIDNGADAPGTEMRLCSSNFIREFRKADLIISKGQGNYETLSDESGKDIFFLLKVKCPVVARDIGYDIGDMVLMRS